MRIALLAPLVSPIAPPFLGGAQALLADLARGLVTRGHAVTLYAAPGSEVPGVEVVPIEVEPGALAPVRVEAGGERVPRHTVGRNAAIEAFLGGYAFMRAFRAVAANADRHDVLHAHAYDWPAFGYASQQPLPIVHTLHLPAVDPAINKLLALLAPLEGPGRVRLVTVSHACAETYAQICRIDRVIYNGVDAGRIPFGPHASDPPYLLFAARMSPEKGAEDALEIAARAGVRLVMTGGVYDQGYFDERVAPRIAAAGGAVTYLGPVDRERLWELMAGARAVLCPSRWDEPFGLVACEAQLAGAPVVGYARGGLREVVASGETGWLVSPDDLDAAARAIHDVDRFDRAHCRERAARLFDLPAMLDAYEALYQEMLVG